MIQTVIEGKGEGKERRAVILARAEEAFGRYGFRRTSMDTIAEAAGCAKGTVYLHFRNKDALFRALAEQLAAKILAEARRAAASPDPIEERILGVLDARFGFVFELESSAPHARELVDPANSAARQVLRDIDREFAAILAGLIDEGARQGDLDLRPCGMSAQRAVEVVIRAAHGTASGTRPLTRAAYRNRLANLVRMLLVGMGG